MNDYIVRPGDREWFKECRRAWDLGSPERQNLEPRQHDEARRGGGGPVGLDRALRDALAVYYFPGMWEWDRGIVKPLALSQLERSLSGSPSAQDVTRGRQLLEWYFEWAPAVDLFWPIRVESDFDVPVPDPERPGEDLVTADGRPLRFVGRIDLLVVDAADVYWMVRHLVGDGPWADVHDLVLDERATGAAWAWELFYLGMRIAGTVHNEVRLGGTTPPGPREPGEPGDRAGGGSPAPPRRRTARHRRVELHGQDAAGGIEIETGGDVFRRVRIPRPREELERRRELFALEAREMTRPGLPVYPSPAPERCSRCEHRDPCRAMDSGGDVAAVLAAGYRERAPRRVEEGRLGGVTWGMGRGAAPPPRWRGRSPLPPPPDRS